MENDRTTTAPLRLRAGFVGAGFMAEVHSRAARAAGAEIAGIASSNPASAARAKDRLGVEQAYASAQDLIEDDAIDVIHVCTPNATHAAYAAAALEAGKHVVCEKPLATSAEDAAALAALARAAGKVAAVPFVYRFHPMLREARARVLGGTTGRILTVQGSYLQDWMLSSQDDNWRVDESLGGPSRAFADIGSHLCDALEFVLSDRILRLSAMTRTVFERRGSRAGVHTEDLACVLFETAQGTQGVLTVSQMAPGRKNRLALELSGTSESLAFDQEQPETLWIGRRDGSTLLVRDPAVLHPTAARFCTLPPGHPQGYQDAFTGFVRDVHQAIRTGITPEGLPLFEDGLRAAALTEAVQLSAREGRWVEVPAAAPAPEPSPAAGAGRP